MVEIEVGRSLNTRVHAQIFFGKRMAVQAITRAGYYHTFE